MKYAIAFLSMCLCASIAQAAEDSLAWPQFRGPGGSGIADGEVPPVEFGPEKNVLWKVPVPSGLSSPVVAGDLLVITALEDDKLYTIAYKRGDGSEAWRAHAPAKKLEPFHKTEGSPAASSVAFDGDRIVTYFGSCGLFGYDLQGKELWKYELPPAQTSAGFGTGVSPVLADGSVILLRDVYNDAKMIVLDAETGALRWEKPRSSRAGFGTPVVWDTPGSKQIAAPGHGRMIGYDLPTGEEKWFVEGMPSSCCTSPVTSGTNLFFAGWSPGDPSEKDGFKMPPYDDVLKENNSDADGDGSLTKEESQNNMLKSFFDNVDYDKNGVVTREEWDGMLKFLSASRNSAFSLKPGGIGDITETHVVWKKKEGLPYVPSAIVYKGQYVMVKDGGIVTAYDVKTGEELYQKRAVASGNYYASPVAANGNIYFTGLVDGTVTVIEGGSNPPQVVAENPPLGERTAATPAIADDTIYIRTAGHLYAFAETN